MLTSDEIADLVKRLQSPCALPVTLGEMWAEREMAAKVIIEMGIKIDAVRILLEGHPSLTPPHTEPEKPTAPPMRIERKWGG